MIPEDQETGLPPAPEPGPPSVGAPKRWPGRLAAAFLATLYLEAGFFLALFPWTHYSEDFAAFQPDWSGFFQHAATRWSITALGIVNLVIGFAEVVRLRALWRR